MSAVSKSPLTPVVTWADAADTECGHWRWTVSAASARSTPSCSRRCRSGTVSERGGVRTLPNGWLSGDDRSRQRPAMNRDGRLRFRHVP